MKTSRLENGDLCIIYMCDICGKEIETYNENYEYISIDMLYMKLFNEHSLDRASGIKFHPDICLQCMADTIIPFVQSKITTDYNWEKFEYEG